MMKKRIITALSVLILGALCTQGQNATPGRCAIKAKADIGLGSAYQTTWTLPVENGKSTLDRFGLEFSYSFWRKGKNSLEAGTGVQITTGSLTADFSDFKYSYSAGPQADDDGDSYIRHSAIDNAGSKIRTVGIGIPAYLQYNYSLHKKWDVYAKTGITVDLNVSSKTEYKAGTVDSYGVYPQYDNLVMDDDWLNGFGVRDLSTIKVSEEDSWRTAISWQVGVGARFRVSRRFALTAGVNYCLGITGSLRGGRTLASPGDVTESQALVTYAAETGLESKPLTSAIDKCSLSRLGLDIGVEVRF